MKIELPKYVVLTFFILLIILTGVAESVGQDSPVPSNDDIAQGPASNTSGILQSDKAPDSDVVNSMAGIRGDVFGRKRKRLHPFISVRGIYSDNIYNSDGGKEGDFIMLISPGLWTSYPASRKKNVEIRTSNMVPGGVTRYKIKPLRRAKYRTYLLYRHDREIFSGNSSENTGSHMLDASYQYRTGKSTISLADKFVKSHDKRGVSGNLELNEYSSNLLSISYDYVKSIKFRYGFGYSVFSTDYSNSGSQFRSRNDSSVAGSVFYRIMPKTTVFGEYKYIDIRYDGDKRLNGSEHHLFLGLSWMMTAKSTGTAKIGQGLKQFDSFSSEDHSDMLLSLDVDHKLSSRNRVKLSMSRRTIETNQNGSLFIISNSQSLSFRRLLSRKTAISAGLNLSQDEYVAPSSSTSQGQEKKNETTGVSLSMDYRINNVFSAGAGYSYMSKKAEPSTLNYTSNELSILISASF